MKTNAWIPLIALATVTTVGLPFRTSAAIIYSGGVYSQNFDGLGGHTGTGSSTYSWANDSTLSGWHLYNKNSTAVPDYLANTGSSTSGSFFSFGSSGSSDRSLGGAGAGTSYFGSPASGAIAGWIATSFENQSGGNLNSITISFNGEQWRNSGAAAQTMVFEYGFGSSFAAVSTWNAPGGAFDWASPVSGGTGAAVDGNNAGLVSSRGGTISGASWAQNETLWLRWVERNDTGDDHALAIDNFQIQAVPEPTTVALGIFAFGLLAVSGTRAWLRARRSALPGPQP